MILPMTTSQFIKGLTNAAHMTFYELHRFMFSQGLLYERRGSKTRHFIQFLVGKYLLKETQTDLKKWDTNSMDSEQLQKEGLK